MRSKIELYSLESTMAVSSISLSWLPTTLSRNLNVPHSNELPCATLLRSSNSVSWTTEPNFQKESNCKRRMLLLGIGALTTSLLPANFLLAEEIPKDYRAFIDRTDGYSYVYPTDWREFNFMGHDSAFRDRNVQLQNVRVRFIPTEKNDIHDLGPMEKVVYDLVKHVYAAPNQVPTIMDMQERNVDGKNYYTFEYELTSPNFSTTSFASIAIGNGRHLTLRLLVLFLPACKMQP
uniref:Photosystem 2 reaction center PsbP family protein n=1 Tax=Rhizophora mucronata TaxID=61149 RepID=A0A2P2LJL8_RHIMU